MKGYKRNELVLRIESKSLFMRCIEADNLIIHGIDAISLIINERSTFKFILSPSLVSTERMYLLILFMFMISDYECKPLSSAHRSLKICSDQVSVFSGE